MRRLTAALTLVCLIAGCPTGDTNSADAGGVADSGQAPADAGAPADSGVQPTQDASAADAHAHDSGLVDAGVTQPDASVDAGPNGCEGDSPEGCQNDDDCAGDMVCDLTACVPSMCECSNGNWRCTPDCGGGLCVEPQGGGNCEGNNPQGCMDDAACGAGFVCDRSICAPSSCHCAEGGDWMCTRDCRGGRCVAEAALACDVPAPSGCRQFGCPAGQTCVVQPGECHPSRCNCSNGAWMCTRDCAGGGTCMP